VFVSSISAAGACRDPVYPAGAKFGVYAGSSPYARGGRGARW